MAEFSEVIKQKKRMCNSTLCCKCDIYHACGEDLSHCEPFIINNPQRAEEIIMRWAAEHPEPVYPTWMAWLINVGAIPKSIRWDEPLVEAVYDAIQKHIPADLAQELGIKPKEG